MANENPNRKTPLSESLKEEWRDYVGSWQRKLPDISGLWRKLGNITQNNYELGLRHLALGNFGDAIMRFRLVIWMEPKHAEAWYYLGCAYLADGKTGLAKKALQKSLSLRPGYEEAIYMMAVASRGNVPAAMMPKKMPLSLALPHFDGLAPIYNEEQIASNYEGHVILTQAVRAALMPERKDYAMLELGVGTGLCGPLIHDLAADLTGVDMSDSMLAEAATLYDSDGRKIYNSLIRREIHDFLRASMAESYDVVMAGNVISYIGDVQELFALVAKALKIHGIFAFTADMLLEGDGFRFDANAGRFRFSQAYLQEQARANGLSELRFEQAPIYPEYMAWLCVFGK